MTLNGGYWTAIAFSPSDPETGYAASHPEWDGKQGRVYRTSDRGQTWTPVSTGLSSDLRIVKLVPDLTDPDTLYLLSGATRFAEGAEALYYSTDGGIAWIQVGAAVGDIADVVLDPADPRTLYVAEKTRGVYRSADGGETWARVHSVAGRLFAHTAQPGVLRIVNEQGVWESRDAGGNWTQKSAQRDWGIAWSPSWNYGVDDNKTVLTFGEDLSDPDATYWVTPQWVYGSFDGGARFDVLHTDESPPGSNWWRSRGIDNTEAFDLAVSAADRCLVYAGLWDMGLWRSLDYGETWQSCNEISYTGGWKGKGGDTHTVLADPVRANVVWADQGQRDRASFLLRSDDFGAVGSWANVSDGLPVPGPDAEIWGLSLDHNSPVERRTLFVTVAGDVFKSIDDGFHWERVLDGAEARITAVDRLDGSLVYAGGDGGLWRSSEGGASGTWTQVAAQREIGEVFDIQTDPSSRGWVYVAGYGAARGLYRSVDGGETWEHLLVDSYMRGMAIDLQNPEGLYATSSQNYCCGASPDGSTGVQRSVDGGRTWRQVNEGLPWPFAYPVQVDPTDPSVVFIGAPGTGTYRRRFELG